jgi:hypothetical protein
MIEEEIKMIGHRSTKASNNKDRLRISNKGQKSNNKDHLKTKGPTATIITGKPHQLKTLNFMVR